MKYVLDTEVVQNACRFLGLYYPVAIRFRNYKYCSARYKGLKWNHKAKSMVHQIDIANDVASPEVGDTCLMHEFTHARQREWYGWEFNVMYDQQLNEIGLSQDAIATGKKINPEYENIRLEQEATRMESLSCVYRMVHYQETKKRSKTKTSTFNVMEAVNEL